MSDNIQAMHLAPGQRVKLVAGVGRPENQHGEIDVGVVVAITAVGDVSVYLSGAGTFLYEPSDLLLLASDE